MTGAIVGGWGWVAAAWGFSLSLLCIYAVWLTFRLRNERDAARRTAEDSGGTEGGAGAADVEQATEG